MRTASKCCSGLDMRVHLSTLTFDPLGSLHIDLLTGDDPHGEVRRRMNRIATLDGGAAFNDFGYAPADMTIQLRWRTMDAAREAAIRRLAELYAQIRVSTDEGLFLAGIERYMRGADESQLTLLVAEKQSGD